MAKGDAPKCVGGYKGFAVFVDHDGGTLFAVPKDKIGPESDLQDDEIILATSYRHLCMLIDAQSPANVPGCLGCSWYGTEVYKYCSACQKLIEAHPSD